MKLNMMPNFYLNWTVVFSFTQHNIYFYQCTAVFISKKVFWWHILGKLIPTNPKEIVMHYWLNWRTKNTLLYKIKMENYIHIMTAFKKHFSKKKLLKQQYKFLCLSSMSLFLGFRLPTYLLLVTMLLWFPYAWSF